MSVRYVLGLMAGTSGDGIDAACVRITGKGERMRVHLVRHEHSPFPAGVRRRLMAVMAPAATTTQELARLHADLGEAFGEAARSIIKAVGRSGRPSLIGLAGQTVCHLPGHRGGQTVALQLGSPARVAAATGVVTVGEFRQSDVAAGGQGAPLVPWTDWVLFRHPAVHRVILNVGGISNVTWLPAGVRPQDVIAFDTGPGNMVIDGLVAGVTGGRERMDRDGRRAARGRVLPEVLAAWLRHPFFTRRPPKSTGREMFGQPFVDSQLPNLRTASRSSDDWIATATALTARTIARACRRFLPGFASSDAAPRLAGPRRKSPAMTNGATGSHRSHRTRSELIVGGGGARNLTLMGLLAAELPGVVVRPMGAAGVPVAAKEAVSFAMLAAACVDRVPANLPQVTGASRRVVLGSITPP